MVRYSFDPKAYGIVLYVNLEGKEKKTIKMIVDTGATYTTIPWETAESMGYEPSLSENRATITTAEGVLKVPLIKVKTMSVLEKRTKDVTVMVHDLPETSRVDGLLGLSYLRNFRLTIDFRNGILELE